MDITSTDLRYHTTDVFAALERHETVNLYKRGKLVGRAVPIEKKKNRMRAEDHPLFGCMKGDPRTTEEIMDEIRAPRFPKMKLKS